MEAASDKQASDIVLLDLRTIALFADFFMICTAGTDRQLRAVVEAIDEELVKAGEKAPKREGTMESGWVLLDSGDVIVHVFAPAERAFYGLDEFWGQAKRVLRMQ